MNSITIKHVTTQRLHNKTGASRLSSILISRKLKENEAGSCEMSTHINNKGEVINVMEFKINT